MGLDTVEFVMDIEKGFSIEISDQDAASMGRIREIADHIEMKLRESHREQTYELIVEKLKEILVINYNVPRDNIHLKSHVVFDLGLD